MLESGYAWVATDTLTTSTPQDTADPDRVGRQLQGFIWLSPSVQGAGFDRLSAVWQTLQPTDCTSSLLPNVSAELFTSPPADVAAHSTTAGFKLEPRNESHGGLVALSIFRDVRGANYEGSPSNGLHHDHTYVREEMHHTHMGAPEVRLLAAQFTIAWRPSRSYWTPSMTSPMSLPSWQRSRR